MRRAAARDVNEAEIVDVLRKVGKKVERLSGRGVPDLLVISRGSDVPLYVVDSVEQALDIAALNEPVCLIEVKDPKKGRLTPDQVEWHSDARGGWE